ncbi:MAG TPA: inorganic diphosphatase [Kofleriaceae bacterium]|nr:inorganic diphosphatase [Kofleriaceae bacterium]
MAWLARSAADAPSFADGDGGGDDIHVVIETPSGSRTKYAWDPELHAFAARKVLPLGTTFPYDFGFVPRTKAGDGDPLDVLVLADEPLAVGCLVRCRVLGAVECTTSEADGHEVRNDRVIAVPTASIAGADWHTARDLGERLVHAIGDFLASYTRREGRRFVLLGTVERDAALALVRAAAI